MAPGLEAPPPLARVGAHAPKPRALLPAPPRLHTPFTRLFARLLGKRVALWDLEGKDWLPLPPEALAERLLYYLRPGSVVLLHDGPERTLRLLEIALPKMRSLATGPSPWTSSP